MKENVIFCPICKNVELKTEPGVEHCVCFRKNKNRIMGKLAPAPRTGEWEDFDKWWNNKNTVDIFMEKCTVSDFAEMAKSIKGFLASSTAEAERGITMRIYQLEKTSLD